jgi:hypothetical protein
MRAVTSDDVCVSDLALDRWFGGALSNDQSAALQQHLARCPRCCLRSDELARHRAAFYARLPSWDKLDSARKRPRRARITLQTWSLPLMAAACLLAIGLGVGHVGDDDAPTSGVVSVRTKGAASIGFYVKRGDHIRRGSSGELVQPGELVRFTYSAEQPVYFALFHGDASGAAVHFPRHSHAQKLEAGRDVPLSFSIRLDALLGPERVYGLFCDEPIAVEPVRAELERTGHMPELPRCHVDPVVLNKRLP